MSINENRVKLPYLAVLGQMHGWLRTSWFTSVILKNNKKKTLFLCEDHLFYLLIINYDLISWSLAYNDEYCCSLTLNNVKNSIYTCIPMQMKIFRQLIVFKIFFYLRYPIHNSPRFCESVCIKIFLVFKSFSIPND